MSCQGRQGHDANLCTHVGSLATRVPPTFLPPYRPGALLRHSPVACPPRLQELFELRKQVKTRQPVKPHVFTHTKRRIGQLQTLLSQRAA